MSILAVSIPDSSDVEEKRTSVLNGLYKLIQDVSDIEDKEIDEFLSQNGLVIIVQSVPS